MSEPSSIFRTEALEHRARGRETPGGMLRLRPRWLRLSFWMLIALLVAGVILATAVHASTSSTGPAVVDARGATFSALLPAAAGRELRGARSAYVDVPDGRVAIKVLAARLVQPDGISRGGLPPAAQASILLSGRVTSGAATRHRAPGASRVAGRITVVLQKKTLGGMLVGELEDMLRGFGGA
jgi:hypothetical protein